MASYPDRRIAYSQNFLTSSRLVDQLLDLAHIGPTDTVYDIGCGRGIITARLAIRCRRVVAIEKDPALIPPLHQRFADAPHVIIRAGDILDAPLPRGPYKVFANIPFNSTTAIVTKLITAPCPPEEAYLVVQKEAAARFVGMPIETLIAILMKPWMEPTIAYQFRRTDFFPVPGVDIVLMRLHKRGPPLIARSEAAAFRDFVTYVFTARQPSLNHTLRRILSARHVILACRNAGLLPEATPTQVCLSQWIQLFAYFSTHADGQGRQRVHQTEARLRCQQARLQKILRTRTPSVRRY